MKAFVIVIAIATIFFSQNSMAQNVGIGTTTPGNLLEIKNSGATTPGLRINNTTATWQLGVGINTANDSLFGIYNSSAGNALVINSSGNVGIGVTVPEYNLSVKNGMNIDQGNGNNGTLNNNSLRFGGIGSGEAISSGRTAGSNNQYGLDFYTSNAKRMVISNAGYVGIGTTTPGNLLEIKNTGVTTPGLLINNSTATWQLGVGVNTANDAKFGIYNSSAGNALVINSSGNVGIGTTNPASQLEVTGYTKLGSDAPSIKIKKYTGTLASTDGGYVDIATGINMSKIISVSVLVSWSGVLWPPLDLAGGVYYTWHVLGSSVRIFNRAGDDVNILSQPCRVVIMYEE